MNKADMFAWKFLVDHGNVVDDWNYYGGQFDVNDKKTDQCKQLIETVGIDWTRTKPVIDSVRSEFTDTFHDSAYVKVMTGNLVLKDGTRWEWGTHNVDPSAIIIAMCEYLPNPFGDK